MDDMSNTFQTSWGCSRRAYKQGICMVIAIAVPNVETVTTEFAVCTVMQQDIARYLLFSAHQQQQDAGLISQLHALRMQCALQAEKQQHPDTSQQLLSDLGAECSRLLIAAGASQQAADARASRCAAATAAAASAGCIPFQLQPAANLADTLLADVAGPQLADQATKAQQLLAQASSVLQQKIAQKAATASAALSNSIQQGSSPGVGPAQQPEAGKRRSIKVPQSQDRKRQLDGAPKASQQQPQPSAAAAARWSNNGGPTSAPKRVDVSHGSTAAAAGAAWAQPQRGAAGAVDDPIEVDDDEDAQQQQDPGRSRAAASSKWSSQAAMQPGRRQQQQPHAQQQPQHPNSRQQGGSPPEDEDSAAAAAGGGGGGRQGFKSARAQLVTDLRKKGQHQQANMLSNQPAPRHGLTRPRGGGGVGGAGGRGGFVPPFVGKAIDHHTGGGGGGAGGAAAAGAGGEEGPLSARTLEMLGVGEDGELPPELAKHDPRLIEAVCNEVIDASGGVQWQDIAGLETVKHLIKEIVVWPMLNPHLFTGPRAPPKGILLFGPPGTGKTLIGKAVASNIRASFFSISASSLTSKWIGEGEKMVKVLFAVAGVMQPSVIFIDEIDSIMSARKADGEHESSRRLKTELLVQMEGCDPASTARRVLLVGATNRPEELDEAARRRLPKQLYIPLPCAEARRAMIERQLGSGGKVKAELSNTDYNKIVARTDGYSGSDMRNLIQEACQGPVRSAVAEHGEAVAGLRDADLRAVVLKDFQHAAKAQRASVTPAEIQRYEDYNARHGAQYVQGTAGGAGDGEEDDDNW